MIVFVIIIISIIAYLLYRKFLINIMRSYEIIFQNFLFQKKIIIQNIDLNLSHVFMVLKLICLFFAFWFFLSVTHMFYSDMCKLHGSKFSFGIVLFGSTYLTFAFLISKICINAFNRKFIHIDEIIDIFLFSYAIGILSLFVNEYAFYPGKKIIEEFASNEKMETIEINVNSKNKNADTPTIHSFTADENSNEAPVFFFSELGKFGNNVLVDCKETMKKAGDPDRLKNIQRSFQEDFPPATITPTSDKVDPDIQTRAKICGGISVMAEAAAFLAGIELSSTRRKYQDVFFTREDYNPPSSPGGTRN